MKIFEMLTAALKDKAASSSRLAEALASARTIEDQARAEADHLTGLRPTLLTDPSQLEKNLTAIGIARQRQADASLFVTELEKRHVAALATEEQVRRQTAYDAARIKVDAANNALAAYEKAAEPLLKLLRIVSTGHLAADDANALLPDGAAGLGIVYPNAIIGLPRKIERETIVDLWCNEGDPRPLGEELQIKVKPTEPGRGRLYSPGSQAMHVVRRSFKRIEYRPAVDGFHPGPLAEGVCIPGLLDPPPRMRHPNGFIFPTVLDHRTVIAAIDEALAPKTLSAPPTRPLVVEYEALPSNQMKAAAE